MAAAFAEEQYAIIGPLVDEKVGQAIGVAEGRTSVSLREIRAEAAESLAGTTAASLRQIEAQIARVQTATFGRVDEAFKAAAAVEKERVDKMFDSASVGF